MTDHLPIENGKTDPSSGASGKQFVAQLVGVERTFRVGDQEVHASARDRS